MDKLVINDDGGTAQVADFPLRVGELPVTSGVTVTLPAGEYAVSEINRAGYAALFAGDCNAAGLVILLNALCSCRSDHENAAPPLAQIRVDPILQAVRLLDHSIGSQSGNRMSIDVSPRGGAATPLTLSPGQAKRAQRLAHRRTSQHLHQPARRRTRGGAESLFQ